MMPLDVAYPEFAAVLNRLLPGWSVTRDGVVGPNGARIVLGERHEGGDGHVDVELVAAVGDEPVRLNDCVTGPGATPADRARRAARIWGDTTAGAWLELVFSRAGRFADHCRGGDRGGFTGCHVIAGAVLCYGDARNAGHLEQWWLSNPVLPAVAAALHGTLREPGASRGARGVKVFLGGRDVAEVRIDGDRHDAASAALAALDWPRLEPPGFARTYVVVLHADTGVIRELRVLSLRAAVLAITLGVVSHFGLFVLFWNPFALTAPGLLAGAAAGLCAGWLTIRSRVRRGGREHLVDGFLAYYAAALVYTLTLMLVGTLGEMFGPSDEDSLSLWEAFAAVWVLVYYVVVAATVLGVVLVPACFLTRRLFWRFVDERARRAAAAAAHDPEPSDRR